MITGWAVALTYISYSAKYRKMADFDQGAKIPEPILMKLGMVDYVQDPTHTPTLVGVVQRGCSLGKYVTCQIF